MTKCYCKKTHLEDGDDSVCLAAERDALLLRNKELQNRHDALKMSLDGIMRMEEQRRQEHAIALRLISDVGQYVSMERDEAGAKMDATEDLIKRYWSGRWALAEAMLMWLADRQQSQNRNHVCGFWMAGVPCPEQEPCPKHGTMPTNRI